MPHINRIRVNNVKYNFGTQMFDDFVMRLSGKNTIYDLANGGGKSVLMLLLLQNMIPNCTLDDKQPIEKLFRAENDNKVIHSLVEWRLNPCHVKNGFIYMTTGFCARKAKEEAEEERRGGTAPIEYFNYCIFYREVNPNDIINLPLQNKEERVTYQGLKNYLRELGKKDYSLEVYIFDGKGEYQRFISQYGIYESEWELVRGINKTEGHVRTFFENNYKTTRKVVEDLFIEEIIEKSYKAKWEGEEESNNIARTLLDIKDKLVELARKKGEIEHFDLQAEALVSFSERLRSIRNIYSEKAGYEEQLVKTCRSVANEISEAKTALEENTIRLAEFNHRLLEIEKETEQGKIAVEETYLRELLAETNNIKEQYAQMEEDAKEREKHLALCEAANSYFEYVENERQMKIQSNAIFDISSKNGDLQEEIQALACHLMRIEEAELSEERGQLEKLELDFNNIKRAVEELAGSERECQTKLAIAQNELNRNEIEAKRTGGRLEEMRIQSELPLIEEVYAALKSKQELLAQLREEASDLRKKERSLIEMTARMETRKSQSEERFNILEARRKDCKSRLEDYDNILKQINKMQEVYGEKGEALFSCVEEAYRTRNIKLAELETAALQLADRKARLENSEESSAENRAGEKSVAEETLKYIRRHYDDEAVTGEEYLSSLTLEGQQEIIKSVPYIGGCIVVSKNLKEAAFDEVLRARIPQNESVVLLLSSEIDSDELNLDTDKIFVLANTPISVLDDDSRRELLKKTEDEIKENSRQIEQVKDNLSVLREDLLLLNKGLHGDASTADNIKKEYERVNDESDKLLQEIESFAENYRLQKEALSRCIEKIEENDGIQSKILEEIQTFKEIQLCFEEYVQLEDTVSLQKNEITELQKNCSDITAELKKTERESENIKNRLDICRKNIQLHNEAVSRYAVYKTDKEYPVISVDKEELEQLFSGKVIALEEKDGALSDRQHMAQIYRAAMEKSEADIKYRGFAMEDLAKLAASGEIFTMSMEELALEKDKMVRSRKRLEDMSKESAHKQSQFDRQSGLVEHGKISYKEKFGEDYVNQKGERPLLQLQQFVAEGDARLKLARAEGKELKEQLRIKEKQLLSLEALGSELTNIIESYEINMEAYSGMLSEETDLAEACKKIRGDYNRLSRQEQKCRESFERDKAQLVETLNLLNSKDLADEIQKQLKNPANVADIETYIENINQTISCIRLEKSRIGQSIENMELMKDNFVKQCLQTCISIKESLERLPKLSNIQLDNQTTGMIQLQIPYIDEKLYSSAMENYISTIVENVDEIKASGDRLKYIRNQLAWKRLFSVLVKDMDKIKLQLYKRERIKEQSRYLKYEEAVGSTGQSQGIYIQFLVAVINYITSMNNNQGQGELLKKVIFIDNPFGAAKDVYIWEPIFAMLKSNHVQLIVPARGVTPAITGRFEVNYILGQKLVGKRQQTVVIDYRSQVEEQFLEYKELEYIQNTFNF